MAGHAAMRIIFLITEIILMALFLTMNASDTLLQARDVGHYTIHPTGNFIISQGLHPLLNGAGNETLEIIERGCWWLHIIGIFAFLNYLPWSQAFAYTARISECILCPPAAYGRNEKHERDPERSIVCDET